MPSHPTVAPQGKIVVTDSATMLSAAAWTLQRAGVSYEILPDGLRPEEVADLSKDADVLILTSVPMQRETLGLLRRVGLIVRCGVGVDLIDVGAATEHGIWVANVPDYAVADVADHTLLLLLAAARHLNYFHRSSIEKNWPNIRYPPVARLDGRRLGIIGLGRIGSQVAVRAKAFGMEVVAYSPHKKEELAQSLGVTCVSLDVLLKTSDVISLHAPLKAETDHILDARAFRRMRRGVIIVNTARGGLIDPAALQSAIDDGTVSAVALDVLEREPFPDLSWPFLRRDNVTITPHVAWYSQEAVRDLGVLAAEEALRYLRGETPRALLNPGARTGGAGVRV